MDRSRKTTVDSAKEAGPQRHEQPMKTFLFQMRNAECGMRSSGSAAGSCSHLQPTACSLQPAGAKRRLRAGFTLMEVNIALLVMAVGLVGLLSLFPVGLRQGDTATSDTTESAFADLVLNGMHANAQMVTNWNDWLTLTDGNLLILGSPTATAPNVQPITVPTVINPHLPIALGTSKIGDAVSDGYLIPGQYLQYSLTVVRGQSPMIVTAAIQITNRRYTDVTLAPVYATSFVYMGM